MDDPIVKGILTSISVVLVATVVNLVVWTVMMGSQVMDSFQTATVASFSSVDATAIIDMQQAKEVDGVSLYRVVNENYRSLNDYSILDEVNNPINNLEDLLDKPNARYTVVVTGSRNAGYVLEAKRKP